MKIVFLDFDGVISSHRAFNAQKHVSDHDQRWLDPVACGLLYQFLVDRAGYRIVVTSTWRKFGYDRVRDSLLPSRLSVFLHEDWRVDDLWSKSSLDSADARPAEIDDWIARNGCDSYIILDDDSFAWTARQALRWVRTSTYDGLTFANYLEMKDLHDD